MDEQLNDVLARAAGDPPTAVDVDDVRRRVRRRRRRRLAGGGGASLLVVGVLALGAVMLGSGQAPIDVVLDPQPPSAESPASPESRSTESVTDTDSRSRSDPWPIELSFDHPHANVEYRLVLDSWQRWFIEKEYGNGARLCRAWWDGLIVKSTAREYSCRETVVTHMEVQEGSNLSPVPQLPRLGPEVQEDLDEVAPAFRSRSQDFAERHGISQSALRVVSEGTESGLMRHSLVLGSVGLPVRHEWHQNGEVIREWEVNGVETRSSESARDFMTEDMKEALETERAQEYSLKSRRKRSRT